MCLLCTPWPRVQPSSTVTGFPRAPALHCPHLKKSVLNAGGTWLSRWVSLLPRFLWLLIRKMDGAKADSFQCSVFIVELVRFWTCLSGISTSDTPALEHTGNVNFYEILPETFLPSKFWKLLYLSPWQPTWHAGGEMAGRGWRLPCPRLLAPQQWDFLGLFDCWASWLAIEPFSVLEQKSGWTAYSVKSQGLPTSALQERHRFLSLYIFFLFWNYIWLRLVFLAGFFASLFPCFF